MNQTKTPEVAPLSAKERQRLTEGAHECLEEVATAALRTPEIKQMGATSMVLLRYEATVKERDAEIGEWRGRWGESEQSMEKAMEEQAESESAARSELEDELETEREKSAELFAIVQAFVNYAMDGNAFAYPLGSLDRALKAVRKYEGAVPKYKGGAK